MLPFGILEEVASVELTWGILGADNIELAQFCTKGVQIASKAWRFDLPEEASDWELEQQKDLQQNAWPQDDFTYTLRLFDRDDALLSEYTGE